MVQELRRAEVYVKTVEDKTQAADWALKRQMMHSVSRGVDWIVLVSDDSDFLEMLRKAREANLGTVVVGDQDRSLGRHAEKWVLWIRVENEEIKENDLELKSKIWREFGGRMEAFRRMELDDVKISSFSEVDEGYEEDYDWIGARLDQRDNANAQLTIGNCIIDDEEEEGDYLLDSEDEELEDAYF
ncbi:unnamed protein product [Fraxinus pennsylvanica]|uniref:NYN domain-containing protein n=1 Tax=Fraxinus pennsylvanica TaxID=56036 RepID=A0AAD1ZXS3_9LAMI|nr:unnamed protein product [Fraxinus pennsylvanica]